ncbi:FIMAH domain-containing protein [Pseudogracilibacillus sp. SO30301A]|uniref:FIMAH domain-containing protein n=1 Tax=Pseudogracilibacillus sp. SO30301A TaxID=3098291 RepID=UPI003FA6F2FE
MKKAIQYYEDDPAAFANQQVVHALSLQLSAIDHFEKEKKEQKVMKHLEGFTVLLNHQKNSHLISDEAYQPTP